MKFKFKKQKQLAILLGAVLAGTVVAEVPRLPPREEVAIQSEIDAAHLRGGGVVNIPAGRHVVGQLDLKSGVELHLEKGAFLEGTSDLTAYPKFTRPYSEGDWMGVIIATNAHDVAVTGEGTILGFGWTWVDLATHAAGSEGLRPRGLVFADCRNVRLEGFTLRDSASWGIVFHDADFADFVAARFATGRRSMADGLWRDISSAADGIPGYVQELCEAIWSVSSAGAKLGAADLSSALMLIFSREGDHYGMFVRDLTTLQFKVLVGLAKMGGKGVFAGTFLAETGVFNAASVRRALTKMEKSGLIYYFEDEYRFVNPFFRQWVSRRG